MDPRCAELRLARDDRREGTAAPVQRWLLVEQPGPWGRNAVSSSRLEPTIARALLARCAAAGLRPLLIRRTGRTVDGSRRAWAVADSRPGHESLRWGAVQDHDQLLTVPLDGSAGEPSADPAYLVCTHARHDACCAIRGRPVAAGLAALRPGQTWECSHVGGDRFAANVVVLPEGLYYGAVTVGDVPGLVAAHEEGRLSRRLLRGRSALPAPVQAAEHHLRDVLGDDRIDAVRTVSVDQIDGSQWVIRLAHEGRTTTVTVRATTSPPLPRLTCAATELQRVTVYGVVAVEHP